MSPGKDTTDQHPTDLESPLPQPATEPRYMIRNTQTLQVSNMLFYPANTLLVSTYISDTSKRMQESDATKNTLKTTSSSPIHL